MRSVIYCRTSLEDQSEYSLEDQEARARAYADTQGWQVLRVYVDDGGSGQKVTRRAFSQMRQELIGLGVKALIVYDLDRFMRNLREQLNLKHELDARGVILVSLSDNGIIDTSTPEGMMNFQVKGMVSDFQAKTTGRKVRDNLQYKARQGGWVGPAPLGYTKDNGELVPSDDAPIVALIFAWYASGNHSYASIAEDLNAAGHTIIDIHTRARKPFGRESVRGILHNSAYIGMVQCSGVEYPGRHQPIVERGLWERVRAIQERRTTADGGKVFTRGAGGLLSEIAYCGRCGARMHWHISGRTREAYYRCGRRAGWGKGACSAVMVQATPIEARALDVLGALAIPPHTRDRVLFEVQRRLTTITAPQSHDRALVQRQLQRLKAAFLAGDEELTDAVYFRERDRLTRLLAEQPTAPAQMLNVAAAIELLCDLPALLATATRPQQRAIVHQLFQCVWLEKPLIKAIAPTRQFHALVEAIVSRPNVTAVDGGCPTGFEIPPSTAIPPRWISFGVPVPV